MTLKNWGGKKISKCYLGGKKLFGRKLVEFKYGLHVKWFMDNVFKSFIAKMALVYKRDTPYSEKMCAEVFRVDVCNLV